MRGDATPIDDRRTPNRAPLVPRVALLLAAPLSFAAVLSLAGCAGDPGAPATESLIGGVETTDHDASVFVLMGRARCSGGLIHPRIALTAWHCITSDPIQIEVGTGGTITTYDVIEVFTPPGSFVLDIEHQAVDVAALVLDREVVGVTPYALAYDGLADRVGEPIRAVAYGTGSDLYGRRQTSTGVLMCDSVRPDWDFRFPILTTISGAPGDSGGSMLDSSGALLAVMSGMIAGGCVLPDGTVHYGDRDHVWGARIEVSAGVVTRAFESIGAVAPTPPPPPPPDGGPLGDDDGGPIASLDGGGAPTDAGSTDRDGGTSAPVLDASPATPADAAALDRDSGSPAPDGSRSDPTIGGEGCSVSAAPRSRALPSLGLGVALLAAAAVRARRRRRLHVGCGRASSPRALRSVPAGPMVQPRPDEIA
jgi:hypothetical protein